MRLRHANYGASVQPPVVSTTTPLPESCMSSHSAIRNWLVSTHKYAPSNTKTGDCVVSYVTVDNSLMRWCDKYLLKDTSTQGMERVRGDGVAVGGSRLLCLERRGLGYQEVQCQVGAPSASRHVLYCLGDKNSPLGYQPMLHMNATMTTEQRKDGPAKHPTIVRVVES